MRSYHIRRYQMRIRVRGTLSTSAMATWEQSDAAIANKICRSRGVGSGWPRPSAAIAVRRIASIPERSAHQKSIGTKKQ